MITDLSILEQNVLNGLAIAWKRTASDDERAQIEGASSALHKILHGIVLWQEGYVHD